MKNTLICIFVVYGIACLSSAVAEQQQCEDSTTLTITLPEDVKKEPTVSPDRLCVKKNGKIDVSLVATGDKPKAMILFSGTTPLVTSKGAKEYSAKISKNGKQLKVKGTCSGDCEFKYSVQDTKNTDRPHLDPVIIIER